MGPFRISSEFPYSYSQADYMKGEAANSKKCKAVKALSYSNVPP